MQTKLPSLALLAALLAVGLAPTASADPLPPEPTCAQVYREVVSEPVGVRLINSCTAEVEATTGAGPCAEHRLDQDLGAVVVESHDSCHVLARAGPGYPNTDAFNVAIHPVLYCLPYYNEYDLGVVVVVFGGCGFDVRPGGALALEVVTLQPLVDELTNPSCSAIYNEWTVGPATVIQRSGCSYELHVAGAQVFPLALQTSGPQCMDVYREWAAGPVQVVSRNSCSYEVFLNDRPVLDGAL